MGRITNNKRKGTAREFGYLRKLRESGMWAYRAYQSAGTGISKQEFIKKFPEKWKRLHKTIRPVDIISINDFAFFHQISKHKDDISQDEIDVLIYEAKKAQAFPILAWKVKNKWVTVGAENKQPVEIFREYYNLIK